MIQLENQALDMALSARYATPSFPLQKEKKFDFMRLFAYRGDCELCET